MSKRFEKSIEDWYHSSKTADLAYLDLAESPNTKDYLITICNNTSVIFDKTCLLSKVALTHFHQLEEQNKELANTVKTLASRLESLELTIVRELNHIKTLI